LHKDEGFVVDFLQKINKGAIQTSITKTLVLMDATGSMSNLLHNAKNAVGVMFERASQVLIDNNLDPNSFQVQFAVYRNYNSEIASIL
jgi:hypothetical protein